MKSDKSTVQILSRSLQWGVLLSLAYIVLIFILPPSQAAMRAHDLSAIQYQVILFAVSLPSILTWLAAFFGYAKLRQYVKYISKTPEGEAFRQLAEGCGWLAWSIPVPAIAGLVFGALANHWSGFYASSIILVNYLNLILPLVAFIIISNAGRQLVSQAKLKLSFASARLIMLLFLAAGVLYCYLTFQQFDLGSLTSTANPYHLPVWLMVLTIIVPYLYTWFIGLLAVYEINLFSRQVNGLLYRHALRWLAVGLMTVIASFIALQYLSSLQPRVGYLNINHTLLWLVIFRIIRGCGFVMIAIGAIKLKKIEEV